MNNDNRSDLGTEVRRRRLVAELTLRHVSVMSGASVSHLNRVDSSGTRHGQHRKTKTHDASVTVILTQHSPLTNSIGYNKLTPCRGSWIGDEQLVYSRNKLVPLE